MFGSSVDAITTGTATRQAHYAGVDAGYFDVMRLPLLPRPRASLGTDVDGGAARRGRQRDAGAAPRAATATRSAAPSASATPTRRSSASPATPSTRRSTRRRRRSSTCRWRRCADQRRALLVRSQDAGARHGDRRAPSRRCDPRAAGAARVDARRRHRGSCCSRSAPPRSSPAASAGRPAARGAGALRHDRRRRWRGARGRSGSGWRSAPDAAQVLRDDRRRRRAAGAGRASRSGLPLAALAMPLLRQWLFELDPARPRRPTRCCRRGCWRWRSAASYLPARRAAATDPLRALRTD